MPILRRLSPGTRFRVRETPSLVAVLVKVNDCRAVVRLDRPDVEQVQFQETDGRIRSFQARAGNVTSWTPALVVDVLGVSPLTLENEMSKDRGAVFAALPTKDAGPSGRLPAEAAYALRIHRPNGNGPHGNGHGGVPVAAADAVRRGETVTVVVPVPAVELPGVELLADAIDREHAPVSSQEQPANQEQPAAEVFDALEGLIGQRAENAPAPVPAPARSAQAHGKLSSLDAAVRVLTEVGRPMNTRDLIAEMAARGYWASPGGATPWATLGSAIGVDLKKPSSRFVKVGPGVFGLSSTPA